MKRQSIILALTLVWGVCLANISHATIIRFETVVIVDFLAPPDLGFTLGQELNDVIVLDFSAGPGITDIANVVSFLGDGGLVLNPIDVNLNLFNGKLTGFLLGMVPGSDIFTLDVWNDGVGRLFVTLPGEDGPLILSGTSVISQVPEPTSLALLSLGLFGLGMVRRRRKV